MTSPALIPEEWKRVLSALHAAGAREAVIQGGALRDLFNGAEIKDVDIFLKSRGTTAANRSLLRDAFNTAGIRTRERRLNPKSHYKPPVSDVDIQTWYATNAQNGTLYNLLCIKGLDDDDAAFRRRITARGALGISQISFDGRDIWTTPHYDEDIAKKQLVVRNSHVTPEYLQRIAKKYPGWKMA